MVMFVVMQIRKRNWNGLNKIVGEKNQARSRAQEIVRMFFFSRALRKVVIHS